MTNEEAIKHIITYAYFDDDIPVQVLTAFDIAISALRFMISNNIDVNKVTIFDCTSNQQ